MRGVRDGVGVICGAGAVGRKGGGIVEMRFRRFRVGVLVAGSSFSLLNPGGSLRFIPRLGGKGVCVCSY